MSLALLGKTGPDPGQHIYWKWVGGIRESDMRVGNAAEEKVRESLKPWRVVSSPLLGILKQGLDGCLSSKKL